MLFPHLVLTTTQQSAAVWPISSLSFYKVISSTDLHLYVFINFWSKNEKLFHKTGGSSIIISVVERAMPSRYLNVISCYLFFEW